MVNDGIRLCFMVRNDAKGAGLCGFNCMARSVVRHFLTGFRTKQVALCMWLLTSY